MTLDEVYARIPAIECQGRCAKSCGPIMCSPQEAERLPAPHRLLRAPSGWRTAEIAHDQKMRCVLLRNGRCTVYELRPAICRLWGVVEGMRCPHGCEPERVLSKQECYEILCLAQLASAA